MMKLRAGSIDSIQISLVLAGIKYIISYIGFKWYEWSKHYGKRNL